MSILENLFASLHAKTSSTDHEISVSDIDNQRCAPTATGVNGNGRFNGIGTAVAPISIAASAGSRCSCH